MDKQVSREIIAVYYENHAETMCWQNALMLCYIT
jgi:hypothetical protein